MLGQFAALLAALSLLFSIGAWGFGDSQMPPTAFLIVTWGMEHFLIATPFPVGWHSLRHTFSTLNGNAGVALPVLQSLLGHASPETTMVDTHPLEDVKRQAVEDLASLLFPNVPSKQKIISKGSELIQ